MSRYPTQNPAAASSSGSRAIGVRSTPAAFTPRLANRFQSVLAAERASRQERRCLPYGY